ncbi:MAG: DUF2513 domain-containing protein [Betaproteobacteria bacterium]|nr:DUF2513 domain-containing protein [Betaproteobacteria bacterium]
MKRDFELIRKILREVENWPADAPPGSVEFPGEYDLCNVNEHLALLVDAGLLDGRVLRGMDGLHGIVIFRVTWEGHDFLGSMKDETVWAAAKEKFLKPGAGVAFDVFRAWLRAEALRRFGLL